LTDSADGLTIGPRVPPDALFGELLESAGDGVRVRWLAVLPAEQHALVVVVRPEGLALLVKAAPAAPRPWRQRLPPALAAPVGARRATSHRAPRSRPLIVRQNLVCHP
jgi:hypothetical protein